MTVSLTKVTQIKCLGAEGLNHRQIALQAQVSRGTVASILSGKHKTQRQPEESLVLKPEGPYVWCPGCHHKVQMPCLACYLRSRKDVK